MFTINAYSFDYSEEFIIQEFNPEETSFNKTIYCLYQDTRDFIWLGTPEGLFRYDGYSLDKFEYLYDGHCGRHRFEYAGAAGGFTGIACMPNTEPVNDNSSVTEYIVSQAQRKGIIRVYPIASITMGRKGNSLTEFGELKKAGAVGITDDGSPVENGEIMRRALEYARYHDLTVISHCEDTDLSNGGQMNEGSISAKMGLKGIPSASEEIMIKRDISLAEFTGCPVHIAHVSTAGSVEAIRSAKEKDIPVTFCCVSLKPDSSLSIIL